jgi:hypothetical protein
MRIHIKTVAKFLHLCALCKERGRLLASIEIMEELHISRSHSYNYLNALKILLALNDQ